MLHPPDEVDSVPLPCLGFELPPRHRRDESALSPGSPQVGPTMVEQHTIILPVMVLMRRALTKKVEVTAEMWQSDQKAAYMCEELAELGRPERGFRKQHLNWISSRLCVQKEGR